MKLNELIFSNRLANRFKRHFFYWMVICLYLMLRMSFLIPAGFRWEEAGLVLKLVLTWNLPQNMLITYVVVYLLVPKFFLHKKYLAFFLGIVLAYAAVFAYDLLIRSVSPPLVQAAGVLTKMSNNYLRGIVIRLFGNSPLICGIFLSLKTLKTWYQKEAEQAMLLKERAAAELQLLKAQIHPHFLFNTLNNIYSFALTKSPLAADLVQKLSDMLSYMITDCAQLSVLLEKEIQMLKDYITLEKVRYGERLDIQMHVNGDCRNKMIAPLLLIPFVENCFKHGASVMRGRQWMHLIVHVNDNRLEFEISNSKPSQADTSKTKNGIGLLNVQKRLVLLYPGKHQLVLNATENIFSVHLTLQLQSVAGVANTESLSSTPDEYGIIPAVHN